MVFRLAANFAAHLVAGAAFGALVVYAASVKSSGTGEMGRQQGSRND